MSNNSYLMMPWRSFVVSVITSKKIRLHPVETWEKTKTSLMWLWSVMMGSKWRQTRSYLPLQVRSSWIFWRGGGIPIPWYKREVWNRKHLLSIIDFLYLGEANVLQDSLESFLALAEEPKFKGLNGTDQHGEAEEKQTMLQILQWKRRIFEKEKRLRQMGLDKHLQWNLSI